MALKLCKGGSQITFASNVKCCIPSCRAKRDADSTLPFYTFPSDSTLCKEWLDEIQLEGITPEISENLHNTHTVCSKHFQSYQGGMKLVVIKKKAKKNTCSGTKIKSPVTSTSTQTYDDDWLRTLKQNSGIEIVCGKHIQCRVCASTSVQAVKIYNKCNEALNLETLINDLLPIKVKPSDKKPLNICVQCIFKLRQFIDLFKCCSKNDQNFASLSVTSNECENESIQPPELKKSVDNDVICIHDSESEDKKNKKKINNHSVESNSNEALDKSKLNTNVTQPNEFVKMENRKHKIKILVSTKVNNCSKNNESSVDSHNEDQCQKSINKVIEVEFIAEYIICHGKEWVHEINVEDSQLKYSRETIDHILEVIRVTMKKQCEKNNAQVVPLPIPPIYLDRALVPHSKQNIRTESVIINGKKHDNDEIKKKNSEMLKTKEPLTKWWSCNKCNAQFDNKHSFVVHFRSIHSTTCRYCKEIITPIEKLLQHEKEHHKSSSDGFICHLCGRQFKTHQSLKLHCKQHQDIERRCCNICNLQFTNGFGLRKHQRQHHKELIEKKKPNPEDLIKKRQKCSKCDMWLSSKLALQVHMKTHLPMEERMKTCPDCKKVFVNDRRFKMHVKTHGPCPIKCPECPRSFPSQQHLDNHLYYHKTTEPVSCDICQRNFKTKITLKNHISRVHKGVQYVQKSFSCTFCQVVFPNKDELKVHENTHTYEEKSQAFAGDKYGKVQCAECNNYFLFKSRLSMHKMYHHSCQCQHCGKRITDNSMSHRCKPRGSRALQYCCQYCTKRFSSKQRLNLHERTHGLDNRFQCTFCTKRFLKFPALKAHISRSHPNQSKYSCKMCTKIFSISNHLTKHISMCHQNYINEDYSPSIIKLPIIENLSSVAQSISPMPFSEPFSNEHDYIICDSARGIEVNDLDLL